MADFIDPLAGLGTEHEPKSSGAKKGVKFEDPLAHLGKQKEEKEPSEPGIKTLARGARVSADAVMSMLGADMRHPETIPEKNPNFLQGMVQDTARASQAEVGDQKRVGPVMARKAQAAGAVMGIPRLLEDLHNTRSGLVYQGGEAARGLIGRNPIEDLWSKANATDAKGNKTAPALGMFLEGMGVGPPMRHAERIEDYLGKATGAPNIVRSGGTNIVNALPVGNAARKIGAARSIVEGAGIAGGLTAVTEAGRQTAETGRTFDPMKVAEASGKSAVGAAIVSGVVHTSLKPFNRAPSANQAESHARDTVVSKKPIEPKPKLSKEDAAWQAVVETQNRLKALDAEAAALGKMRPRIEGELIDPVAPGTKEVLERTKVGGDGHAERVADQALRSGEKVRGLESDVVRMEQQQLDTAMKRRNDAASQVVARRTAARLDAEMKENNEAAGQAVVRRTASNLDEEMKARNEAASNAVAKRRATDLDEEMKRRNDAASQAVARRRASDLDEEMKGAIKQAGARVRVHTEQRDLDAQMRARNEAAGQAVAKRKNAYYREHMDNRPPGTQPVDKEQFLRQLRDEPEAPPPAPPPEKKSSLLEQLAPRKSKEDLEAIVADKASSDHEARRQAQLELKKQEKKQDKPKRKEPLELKRGKAPPEYDGPVGDEIAHGDYELKHFGKASEPLSGTERNANNSKSKRKRDKYWSVWDAQNASSLTDVELNRHIAQIEEDAQYRHTAAKERDNQHNYTRLTNERDRREYRRKHGRGESWAQPDYEKMTDQELHDEMREAGESGDEPRMLAAQTESDRREGLVSSEDAAPAAVPKKDDHIGTRAEFKEANVDHRPATVAESIKYGPAAESAGEYYHLRAHHRAGAAELAELIKYEPGKIKKTSKDSALSAEAKAIHKQIAEKVAKMRDLVGEDVGPGSHAYDATLKGEVTTGKLRGEGLAEKYDHWQRIGEEMEAARKEYQKQKRLIKEEGRDHPRALMVKTERGDVLLESYNQLPGFTETHANELIARHAAGERMPEFEQTHGEWLELKAAKNDDGSYFGIDWDKLSKDLMDMPRRFMTEESGSGYHGGAYLHDVGAGFSKTGKELKDIWRKQFIGENKKGIQDFLKHQETIDAVLGKPKLAQRLGDNIKLALAMKNDLDWVRGYDPQLARRLEGIRSRMDDAGQNVSKLSQEFGAREEFARATDMTAEKVRKTEWEHLTPDQVEFIGNISELRAEAADMISHAWDDMDTHGAANSMRAIHLQKYYEAWTHGVDIRTGKRAPKPDILKLNDHLQSGAYDAMVTANKRIHVLHIVDTLTMGMSVVHPKNLAMAGYEILKNAEVRKYLDSFQGNTVYTASRSGKPTWFDKHAGRAIESAARAVLGKKGLEIARLWEGGWLEHKSVELVRAAALLKAGKEMGYKGNLLQDIAREHATGKQILNPIERTDASIRVMNSLEDARGYNPSGFVNRNAFKQLGIDRVFPFMGIRSVQNRLIGKYISEKNGKSLLTLMLMTQGFAGSSAVWAPVETAMKAAAPELYLRLKPWLQLASFAGAAEAVGKKTGMINEGNEQWVAPFLRSIEHIQPEIAPWLFNPPEIVNGIFEGLSNPTPAKFLLVLSAAMGGSNLAGITTPSEMEALWRRLDKGFHGEVTYDDEGKPQGGKKMANYEKGVFGEQRHGGQRHVPTTPFREFMNHMLPQMDVMDEKYINESKYGSLAREALERRGKTPSEVNSLLRALYEEVHEEHRPAESEDFIRMLDEN